MSLTATFLQRAAQEPGKVSVEGDVETDSFRGLPVVIENRKGTIREGTDPNGHHWAITMKCDYGYVPSTEAAGDKEGLDVFIGDDLNSEYAYAVEQLDDKGEFDEYKIVLGAPDLQTAEELYLSNYEDGWEDTHVGDIDEIPLRYLFDGIKDNIKKNAALDIRDGDQVIKDFLRNYDFEFYERVATEVQEFMEDMLRSAGVRSLVTSRAKRVESLRRKLENRHTADKVQCFEDILNEIKDLAGVRIALYFPHDQEKVAKIISENFKLAREPKMFPRDASPEDGQGYRAVHYVVFWEGTVVEVQVASMLMHAFSEVNHDLGYKPQLGALSNAEMQIIDMLGALVGAGEASIDELQVEIERRTGTPLQTAVIAALKRKFAAAQYYATAEEIDVTPKKKSRYEKLCERRGVTADEMDDRLRSLWSQQGLTRPVGEDDKYVQQALAEIAPGALTTDDIVSDVQHQVFERAQQLKAMDKKV